MQIKTEQRHPQGSILLITLVTLALLALMGFALSATAVTELSISGDTNQGRQAFTRADGTARLAILMTRPLFQPGAGTSDQYLSSTTPAGGRPPFVVALDSTVEISADLPEIAQDGQFTMEDIRKRYLTATAAGLPPHLTLKYGDEVVGSAYVSYYEPQSGASSGGGGLTTGYNGGSTRTIYLIITADGRLPLGSGADPGNYYSGDQDSKHSIITTIYRDVF